MSSTVFIDKNNKNINTKYDLIQSWGGSGGKIQCSYTKRLWDSSDLIKMSKHMAQDMSKSGFVRGDVVAVLLSNTVAFPVVLMALLYLECNPLLLHVSTPTAELKRLLDKIQIKGYIHDFIQSTSRLNLQNESLQSKIVWTYEIENISLKAGIIDSKCNGACHDTYGVVFHLTSGTSGQASICMRDQEVALAEAINYTSLIDIYNRARVVITTPLSHAFAYGFGLISSILTNSTLILNPVFNPRKILLEMTRNPCDILTIVPPMIKMLIHEKKSNPELEVAKNVFYAGTRCDDNLVKKFEEVFNRYLYTIYGSTETGGISTNYSKKHKLPNLGKPFKNVDIEIRNKDKYKELGPNIGEIRVKSTSMMQGYYKANGNIQDIEYFPVGDIGLYDKSLKLLGRTKDIINIGGLKVDPGEIEGVVLSYPNISDVAVYSGKIETGDEVILCAISTKDTKINIDLLRRHCLKNLAYYKIPRSFYIVEKMPRTASGKCIKVKLPGYTQSFLE